MLCSSPPSFCVVSIVPAVEEVVATLGEAVPRATGIEAIPTGGGADELGFDSGVALSTTGDSGAGEVELVRLV